MNTLRTPLSRWLWLQLIICLSAMGTELRLKETIRLAIRNHPITEADKYHELSEEKEIDRARAFYYPRLNLMALETKGFPGSASATGVGGLMVSPYHKGPSAGMLLEQEIFDFGRTSASVTVGQKKLGLARAQSKVGHLQVGFTALDLYVSCVLDRSLAEVSEEIYEEAKLVQREVAKFVSTGQRSVVDKYLSESQTEELATTTADFTERTKFDTNRLSTFLSAGKEPVVCPSMTEELAQESISEIASAQVTLSPLVLRAEAEIEVSQAEISHSRKDYYPRLVGIASFGYLNDTELGIPIQNYSVAVGLIFPLFEGFKTNSEVEKGLAKSLQREKELAATKLELDETNQGYDKEIQSAKRRITHLRQELTTAETGFRIAKQRYFATSGTLVDLREALRNLARVKTEKKEAESQFLAKSANKALLNGGLIEELAQ